jgi:hypothetical protein
MPSVVCLLRIFWEKSKFKTEGKDQELKNTYKNYFLLNTLWRSVKSILKQPKRKFVSNFFWLSTPPPHIGDNPGGTNV